MALEHALLVALREQPASGLDLARRFGRSIGFFWSATHQQIYKVLGRMESDGWVEATEVSQSGKPDKKVYDVTPAGRAALAAWLAEPTPTHALRSDLAVKMRGASFGDREAVLDVVRANLADHHVRLDHYRQLMKRDYPDGSGALAGLDLDQYLVLRGGILTEETWVAWLTEYLEAHA
ncbi:PadR family transcriptional regulator [Nocardioides szechwanensis]|uniref:Transcriptional regulator, PadR family n=1 Tax=Nocardioides szechwanensis TaxID=1005944 RepID=A0A1H0E2Q5_9ACTN|nr:PadR family transcriptional regulator [Nocardioides szechwanensis]GEP36244.1 PadR family transcriptional regulator [Nocardioides szechwanensis]SDN76636.1 transcriptional regulator, PadR family [Nocardioides szechwanensis]